ncbi:MAG: DUF6868 family protein [Roseibium sp.]
MTLDHLTHFLAWCTLINIALLLFSTVCLYAFSEQVRKIHSKLFDIDENKLPGIYFKYLAAYKILIIVFNLVPYIALRIIA